MFINLTEECIFSSSKLGFSTGDHVMFLIQKVEGMVYGPRASLGFENIICNLSCSHVRRWHVLHVRFTPG